MSKSYSMRVDVQGLPQYFPTHAHPAKLWEALGRAVATYGFLEEILKKASFAYSARTQVSEKEATLALANWKKSLAKIISGNLSLAIDHYEIAVKKWPVNAVVGHDILIADLRKAAVLRNVLCHGSWRPLREDGKASAFYTDKKRGEFTSHYGVEE